jgi:hypothetical protein
MTSLTEITESLGITINLEQRKEQLLPEKNGMIVGRKRRTWLNKNEKDFVNHQSVNTVNAQQVSTIEQDESKNNLSLVFLRSNPLKIAQYIFEMSVNEINNITKPINSLEIVKLLQISKNSIKTAISFLIKNFILERINFQTGKNGWSTYKLKTIFFNEIKKAYQNGTISSLKYYNNALLQNTHSLTTSQFDEINISQLEDIGLKINHVHQLKTKSSPQIIQESIYHFAYGLKFNPKTKAYSDPLSVLMGVLRKGEAWIEVNYKSTQEIAQENINNNLRLQTERLQKLEQEAFNLAFAEWNNSLSKEEIFAILQNITEGSQNFIPKKVRLKTHFNEKIWADKKTNYLAKQ